MSINNILSNRSNRDITAAMKKMADGKLNLTVTPAVQIPDKLDVHVLNPVREVSVSNIGDVLKSLALLGKGIQQLSESVEMLRDSKEASEIKFPDFPEMPDMSELAKSIKALQLQIKKIPQQTAVEAPVIEIPKSFRVDNLDELKRGFVAINDNLVKLAGVVRDSQANITLPEQDTGSIITAVERVENAIRGMVFPIPTPGTPSYKNTSGLAVSVTLDSQGRVPVAGTLSGGGDGAIQDGADSGIEATVFDYTSANPLAVRLSDTNGDYVSAGGGTQYTEDAAAAANPVGTAMILVREDARAGSLTTTDGDNVAARGNNKGELYVKTTDSDAILTTIDADTGNIATSVANIDADTSAIQTAVELIDDTVATLGTTTYTEATSKGLTIGAVRRDADTTLVNTTNEIGPLQMDANGRLKVEAFSGEALPVTLTSTTVTGTVAVTQSGTWDEVGINDSGNSITVDNGGTFVVQENGGALTALQIMDDWDNGASDGASVSGDVAHDTADAGEPVKIGGKAIDLGANPTEVTANDRTNGYFTRAGQLFTIGGHPNIISKNLTISDADGAQTDTAIVTVSAGTAIVVTSYEVTADNANTGDCACRIGFGATNTPALDAAGVIMNHTGIAPGSGVVRGDGSGILGIGASNEDLRCTTEDPAGGNLSITVTYYTILIG